MDFILGDIEKINLKKRYDIILSLEVAEHLQNFEAHLDTIKKHLKEDGILILSTPNGRDLLKDIYRTFRRICRKNIPKEIEESNNKKFFSENINVMPYSMFFKKMEEADFKILEKKRTQIVFGNEKLDKFYGEIFFLDWILPKNTPYLGAGYIIKAGLKNK